MSRILVVANRPLAAAIFFSPSRSDDWWPVRIHLARPCHCPRPPREHDGDADPPYNEHAGY